MLAAPHNWYRRKGLIPVSLFQVYARALSYLGTYKLRVGLVVAANVILAVITIAEPILFGRIIDAISSKGAVTPLLLMWAGFGLFNTIAYVLVAREADRLAHGRRASLLTEAFGRIISMPLAWHSQRGTSNALHTLLRACETLFSLWLEFMRTHLATAVALALLIPTAFSMDYRLSLVLVVLGALYVVIGKVVMNRTREGQASVENHYHTVFSHVSDSISNVSVVHSYNRIEAETRELKRFAERLINAQFPVLDWWALASALNRIASTISMMTILVIGTVLVQRGEIRVGDVIAFIGFAGLLIGRLDQMKAFATQIFEARAKLEDFFTLEDAVKDREEPTSAGDLGDVPAVCLDFDEPVARKLVGLLAVLAAALAVPLAGQAAPPARGFARQPERQRQVDEGVNRVHALTVLFGPAAAEDHRRARRAEPADELPQRRLAHAGQPLDVRRVVLQRHASDRVEPVGAGGDVLLVDEPFLDSEV